MLPRRFCVILLLLISHSLLAQKQGRELIDSLRIALPRMKDDTNKVNILNKIGYSFFFIDPDSGVYYGRKALTMAQATGIPKSIAGSYRIVGINYMTKSMGEEAMGCFDSALQLFNSIHDADNAARVIGNMAQVYDDRGDYASALEYNLRAMKIYDESKNEKGKAFVYANLGNIYISLKKYPEAMHYYDLSLSYHTSVGDTQSMAIDLGNLGNSYFDVGDYQKALDHDQRALQIYERLGDSVAIANKLQNIAEIHEHRAELAEALDYAGRALRIYERADDQNGKAIALGLVGRCHLVLALRMIKQGLGGTPAAKDHLQQAVTYTQKAIGLFAAAGELIELYTAYSQLTDALEARGNYKDALAMYRLCFNIKDSVLNADKNVKFANLEKEKAIADKKHADEERRAQVQITQLTAAKRRNETILFTIGILVLLAAVIVVTRERKKTEQLLLNTLPAEVAAELKKKGSSDARLFDNVTVLFTDFVGFTNLSEQLNPKQLVDELHACFTAFDGIMMKHNIEKIKTVGDAYLAVCGLPVPNSDHAENVVRAAIDIREFMLHRKKLSGDAAFDIRIGVHSGNVVAGIVGVKKFAYDIWGDTVNTAARMEQHSTPGKINISETTYQLVKNKFTCEYRGEVQAKNKGMMRMYYVTQ